MIMRLRIRALALATGTVMGLAIFVITWLYIIMGYDGFTLEKITNFLFGYSIRPLGTFIGLGWGFLYGFIGGAIIGWLYNKYVSLFPEKSNV